MTPGEIIKKIRGFIERVESYELPPGMRKKIAYAVVGITMLCGALLDVSAKQPPNIEVKSKLEIHKTAIEMKGGGSHVFDLEVAKSPTDLEVGLMFRKSMEKDHGMLFEMGRDPKMTAFWMKNTYIPLDIIFVDQNGVIVNIHRNATPQSLDSIPSIQPVTGVIELNGGRANELGINIGDTVIHPYFHTQKSRE